MKIIELRKKINNLIALYGEECEVDISTAEYSEVTSKIHID